MPFTHAQSTYAQQPTGRQQLPAGHTRVDAHMTHHAECVFVSLRVNNKPCRKSEPCCGLCTIVGWKDISPHNWSDIWQMGFEWNQSCFRQWQKETKVFGALFRPIPTPSSNRRAWFFLSSLSVRQLLLQLPNDFITLEETIPLLPSIVFTKKEVKTNPGGCFLHLYSCRYSFQKRPVISSAKNNSLPYTNCHIKLTNTPQTKVSASHI